VHAFQHRRTAAASQRYKTPKHCDGRTMKIISMSLYGNGSNFISGALENAKKLQEVYPGWILRVYTSSGPEVAAKLRAEGAEVMREIQNLSYRGFQDNTQFRSVQSIRHNARMMLSSCTQLYTQARTSTSSFMLWEHSSAHARRPLAYCFDHCIHICVQRVRLIRPVLPGSMCLHTCVHAHTRTPIHRHSPPNGTKTCKSKKKTITDTCQVIENTHAIRVYAYLHNIS